MFLINMTSKLIISSMNIFRNETGSRQNSPDIFSEEKSGIQNPPVSGLKDCGEEFHIKTVKNCMAASSGVCNGK